MYLNEVDRGKKCSIFIFKIGRKIEIIKIKLKTGLMRRNLIAGKRGYNKKGLK